MCVCVFICSKLLTKFRFLYFFKSIMAIKEETNEFSQGNEGIPIQPITTITATTATATTMLMFLHQ